MKDQEFQALQSFQDNYKQFHIAMKLLQQNSLLQISVQNKDNFDKYHVGITMQYIEAEKDFANIFVEPIEIMDYIIHHFKDVVIEEGVIKFQYLFGTIKKRLKLITIKMNKVEMDPLQLAQLKVAKLSQTLIQKEAKIKNDQQKMIAYQKQIARLTQIVYRNKDIQDQMIVKIQRLSNELRQKEDGEKKSEKASQKSANILRQKMAKQELLLMEIERLNQVLMQKTRKQQTMANQIGRLSQPRRR